MPEIIWDSPEGTKWVPALGKIVVSDEPYLKGPMALGHEIGHWKYDQSYGDTDPLVDMYEERDAWRYAISRLPPDEIDMGFLRFSLVNHLEEVADLYGRSGHEYKMAKRMMDEVLELARKKKGVY